MRVFMEGEMPGLGGAELIIILLYCAMFALPVAAWIYLYRSGAAARDMIFWGVIVLLIPVLGPIATLIFFRNRRKTKTV